MKSISITYKLKWMFKDYPHIRISECKKVFNVKTGRQKKLCVNGYSKGFWITSKKFIVYKDLNSYIVKIPRLEFDKSNINCILAKI